MIDLRSDTVTRPSEGMRRAMYEAEVGDDVYGEDPTVNRLQERIAECLGTEDALFVPSGTMANQICLHILTEQGDEVVLERGAHIFNFESGASSLLSGIQLNPIHDSEGLLTPDQVEHEIRPDSVVFPRTQVVSIENTANRAGGIVYPLDRIQGIAEVVHENDLYFHLDGARLWNAAVALGVEEADLVAPFDIAWVALSKGLGAPAGSVIAGPEQRIAQARRARKRFGGGMRQAGILAAAGLYALENHRPELDMDHQKAQHLAAALKQLSTFTIDPERVETNILIFEVETESAAAVVETLDSHEIRIAEFGPSTLRAVTHRDVAMEEIQQVVDVLYQEYE